MSELTELLKEVERLDQAATKGPWVADTMNNAPYVWNTAGDDLIAKTWQDIPSQGAANRDFIAFARTALPRLARELADALARLGEKGS